MVIDDDDLSSLLDTAAHHHGLGLDLVVAELVTANSRLRLCDFEGQRFANRQDFAGILQLRLHRHGRGPAVFDCCL
jgi:hypothetical protein